MSSNVTIAFESARILVSLTDILPVKQLHASTKISRKYQQIAASIREVGIIEPPVVARAKGKKGKFLLLDGHLRIAVLKDLDIDDVTCLVSTDDEAFTYNKRINKLATIQEHKMILKAIKRGVPEDRIAKALDINVTSIRQKRLLLDGICAEAADLLKDLHCPLNTFYSLKKMKPLRQVEVADLMIAMNNFSVSYSRALLAATPQEQLIDSGKQKAFKGISSEQMMQMEKEMASLQREIKLIEESYGPNHLNLVLARGYLVSLVNNSKVVQYLTHNHCEILVEFEKISESASMTLEAAE
ncbi:plasmid partitioning protein RepB C-terminal domain-containing protein [Magnetovibrio blakemorei]|uniref:Chromosome partitioning protein ParB n=1 Tax=Magnetovibrio blakemorei TaxID=28181 RepID=A0A1E5Q5J9_9PROT|nr:plasmid partitioning protein RepB C-terminal domain-containing protein [Magnetovibrio blakemorei]OEJ65499.1 chromosome partitioning protein ParB [Magnetovibrio blakemorei]